MSDLDLKYVDNLMTENRRLRFKLQVALKDILEANMRTDFLEECAEEWRGIIIEHREESKV